jgi:ABC-type multidrug transport system permease subunit
LFFLVANPLKKSERVLTTPIVFLLVVFFCGVVVPPQGLPTVWREWMYWFTPFHCLLQAFLGAAIHD